MLKPLTIYATVVFYLLELINTYCHLLQWLSRDMARSDINEIKIIIRGLLVSSPEEINVGKLRHDFRTQEGHDIPFYEYGYHDITSFLRSIPDVCQISCNENGPYAIVRLVESDKSAHVSSLVMRQRVSVNKGRKRHSGFAVRGRHSHIPYKTSALSHSCRTVKKLTCKPLHSELASKECPRISCSIVSVEEPPVCNDAPSEVPECDTLHSPPNGFVNGNGQETWPCVNQEESELTSEENYTYVPDTSDNEYNRQLPAFVNFHLRQLLTENKFVHLNEVTEHIRDSLCSYGFVCSKKPDSILQILRTIPNIKIENDHVYLHQSLYEDQSCEELVGDLEAENISQKADNIAENENTKQNNKGDLRATADIFVPSGKNEKIQRLERNLFSLMKDHSSGILGSELKEKYKMKFAAPLNLQILGCNSVWDLASSLPHIFNSIYHDDGNFMLFPASLPSEQLCKVSKSALSDSKKKYFIPAITKRNVQWLMQGYSNGLNSYDFEQTYQDTFLGDIELTEMGFSSMDEFLNALEEQGVLQILRSETGNWLVPSEESGNFTVDDLPLPQPEKMDTEMYIRALKEKFPSDVVGPDTHVEQVEIPLTCIKGKCVDVFVQEVNNPHHFWITFYKHSPALNALMDDLQAFYCTKSHSYRMALELIREGQDCVTQYADEWHRARITRVINAAEVEVFFYDYGTRSVVRKDSVHYLKLTHSDLPAQAIRAAMANIAPVENTWPQKASQRFLKLIANKGLCAIIKTVDRVNKVFSLFLCDTRGNEDIYIHEVLVKEGHAVLTFNETSEKKLHNDSKEEVESAISSQFELESQEPLNTNTTVNNTDTCVAENKVQKHPACSSNSVQEIGSQNARTSSLPSTLTNKITCVASVPPAAPVHVPASSSNSCAPLISKVTSNSSSSSPIQQVAPPPGFCNVLNCEPEVSDNVETESPALRNSAVSDVKSQVEEAVEIPKQHRDDMDMDEIHELCSGTCPDVAENQNVDRNQSVKGVSSGVNANFPQEMTSPCIPSANTYPSWMPTQTYSQFPGFAPSFPPMNFNTALAPMPLTPFPLPPLPSPLDFYSLMYYEQCRQQLLLQGVLAQQQMAASALPPLPPGLYVPHSQSLPYIYPSQNSPMNISEVQSPESSRPCSASRQMEMNADTTQTSPELSLTKKKNGALPSEKLVAAVLAADASAQTTDDILSVECLGNDDANKSKETSQANEVHSESLFQDAAKEGDTAPCKGKDTNDVGIGTCNLSSALSHTGHILDSVSVNNTRTSSLSASSTSNELKFLPLGSDSCNLQLSSAIQCSVDVHQSQMEIKNEEKKGLKECVLEKTQNLVSLSSMHIDDFCDLEVERSNKQIVESDHFVSEVCEENIDGQQIMCDEEKFEENTMVLSSDVSVHEKNTIEKIKSRQAVNDSVDIVDGSFIKRIKELEVVRWDSDPKVLPSSINEKDREIAKDVCSLQTIKLIEKETIPETVLVSGTVTKSSEYVSASSLVHPWTKTFAEGSRNLTTESAKENKFSISEIHSQRLHEVQKNSEVAENDRSVEVDELEVLEDLSVQSEKSATVPLLPIHNTCALLSYSGSDQEKGHVSAASDTLCSDFKTLTVSKLGPSDEILFQNKQKHARVLPAVSKRRLQTTSDVAESSVNVHANDHNGYKDLFSVPEYVPCTDRDRTTIPPPCHNVQEEKEDGENDFVKNSWAHDTHNTVTSRTSDMTTDKTQLSSLVHTAPSKKGRPVLGAKLSSGVSESISCVQPPASIQKPPATWSDKLGAKLSSEVPDPVATVSPPAAVLKAQITPSGSSQQKTDNLLTSESLAPSWKTTWGSEERGRHISKEIGPEGTKNLPIGSGHRNLSKQTNAFWHKESHQSTKHATSQQFVKKICLCDKKIHLINLDGRPYVPTDEIVSYFTPFNGRHVILKILEARKVEINFLEFSRRRRPEFFECLDKSDISCLSRGPTGNVIGSVHIVPLRSVPYMLRALNKDDASLSMEVKNEMEKFDPNDSYWSGCR